MALTTQRINGVLVETDDTNLKQQAQLAGQALPTSPAGAHGVGASPDSAKMVGSSAQKATVIEQAVAPADTLQTAQRTAAPRQKPDQPAQEAAEKAAKIQTLGSLGTRVEALIKTQLSQVAAAPLAKATTDKAALNAISDPAVRTQAQTLAQAVIDNPSDMSAQAAAANFWQTNNLGEFNVQNFLATAQDSFGDEVASKVADSAPLETLGLDAGESAALDEVFGDDSWKALTVPQLQQKIEDMKQAEFSRVQGLKAELRTAKGAQRQGILDQLAEAGDMGVTGAEQAVAELDQQIEAADTVMIGGEEYKVEELLKDEQVSDLVKRMLNDPKLAAEVAKTSPEFAQWVEDSRTALAKLSDETLTAGDAQFDQLQTAKQAAAKVGNVELSDAVMSAIFPDWDKATAGTLGTSTSGIMNYLKSIPDDQRQSLANAVQAATTDPEMMAKLKALDEAQLKMAFEAAKAIDDDETGILAGLTGVGLEENFVLDGNKQLAVAKMKSVTDALQAAREGAGPGYDQALADPALKALIKSGEFGPKHAALLAKDPTRLDVIKNYGSEIDKIDNAVATKNMDKLLDAIFGRDVDMKQLTANLRGAKDILKYMPKDKNALDLVAALSKFDTNKDGKITHGDDINLVAALAKKDLSGGKGKELTLEQLFTNDKVSKVDGTLDFGLRDVGTKLAADSKLNLKNAGITEIKALAKSGGKLKVSEIHGMSDASRAMLLANPAMLSKLTDGKITSKADYVKQMKNYVSGGVIKNVYTELKYMDIPGLDINPKNGLTGILKSIPMILLTGEKGKGLVKGLREKLEREAEGHEDPYARKVYAQILARVEAKEKEAIANIKESMALAAQDVDVDIDLSDFKLPTLKAINLGSGGGGAG
jgi:hypothetical protein